MSELAKGWLVLGISGPWRERDGDVQEWNL